jgi:ribulose 1,5-bisphosphate carboxylase large subunit-like protein
MIEYIDVYCTVRGTKSDGKPMDLDDATNLGGLIARDATYGTFGEFTGDYWDDKILASARQLASVDLIKNLSNPGEFGFRLRIASDLFKPTSGGIQHLIGILAGDLGILQVRGLTLSLIRVTDVEFPDAWKESMKAKYRSGAHSIEGIRRSFALDENKPLLAFSLKPRIGLTFDALEEITLGVLAAGFHLVELDTRNLDLEQNTVDLLTGLSQKAAEVGKQNRITRFSINLSASAEVAIPICASLIEKVPAPMVVKIDGGLDGITTIQAIRSAFNSQNGKETPVITTYPLLRNVIGQRIADDTFLNALVLSGSDIIYPGGAPNLGGYRQLDHSIQGALANSVDRYLNMCSSGFPMPTVAGGIYPGQLQAYYELLGPDVAYFLGGGVALHKSGPVAGASLCVRILREARKLRERAGRAEFAAEISGRLLEEAEGAIEVPAGADENTFRYIPVQELKSIAGLKPWFKR